MNNSLRDTDAGIYDGYQVPMGSLESQDVLQLLGFETVGCVLDVGCADGQFAGRLAQSGWTSFGNDISLTNALSAKKRCVNAVVCDLNFFFPYAEGYFSAVVAKQVCEHLIDTRKFFSECWRVLAPGGCLVVGTPNLASLANRIRLLCGRYPVYMDYELGGQGHVRYYTMAVLRQQLTSLGFHIDAELGGLLPIPILSRFLSGGTAQPLIWLGRRFPSLSDNLVIMARKPHFSDPLVLTTK